jgi:hypothetical protein
MSDWLHDLPVLWRALMVFGATYLTAGLIHAALNLFIFGLYFAFTAAQVWGDIALRQPPYFYIAMGLFATGVAVSVLLIASHDRPFTGEISVGPDPLLQVLPES